MKNKVIRILAYILGILPLIVLVGIYNRLPELVPIHWGFDGDVTYSAKTQLWFVFSISIIIVVLMDVLPKIDPKKENYKQFGKSYDRFAIGMVLFMDSMCAITVVESFWPNTLPVGKIVIVLCGVLFIVLGNNMPKIKTNFYMGLKTPWTLSNTNVWNKAHRLTGKMMFGWGMLMALVGLLMNERIGLVVIIAGCVCITIIPTVMSYIWYKQEEKE